MGEKALTADARPDPSRPGGPDLNAAFDVLSRATSCFDLLTQKLDQVEGERDEALAQIEEHRRTAIAWQEMIETVQSRLRDAERDLADMRQEIIAQQDRADREEGRADKLDAALKLRDRHFGALQDDYNNLHARVVSSFGNDSQTYRTLESLVGRLQTRAA